MECIKNRVFLHTNNPKELFMKRYSLLLITLFCFLSTMIGAPIKWNQAYQTYINQYKDIAIEGMLKYGVPASITLAQGLLESSAGRSDLVIQGNNHFGIKCHGWTGRTVYHDDDLKGECFRAYPSALDSYEDHCKFLRERPRFRSLFDLDRTDYRGWAYGLKRAGYATNPSYAQMLINIIELYKLYEFDKAKHYDRFMVKHSGEEPPILTPDNGLPAYTPIAGPHPIHKYNENYYIIVRQGDTFKSLSKELDISAHKLARYNERNKKDKLIPGEYIWLKKKRKKAPKNFKNRPYYVRKSESMYDIAQKYGIRLKSLVKKNKAIAERGLRFGDEVQLY